MNIPRTPIQIAGMLLATGLLVHADFLVPEEAGDQVRPAVPQVLKAFPMKDVRLLDGPFQDAKDLDKKYLMSLEPRRLLAMFEKTAGLESEAETYGGWERAKGELRGHSIGHYLSACSLMYASTGDPAFLARVDKMVNVLSKCQEAMPSQGYQAGFLSAYPEEFFDRVDACKRVWAPYYTLHKIMAGLMDAYMYCGNHQALDILNKMADWLKLRVGRLSHEQQQKALGMEHGGMNEVLANLYSVTGNRAHLELAQAFNHEVIFEPLSQGLDKLDGRHANTQIPKIIGAIREYELTGDQSLLKVAQTFWNAVALNRSYAIGGHSDREHFFPVKDFESHLGPETCETCNTYNMLKLTRHLFAIDPSAKLMDFYERALYNQILGSIEPKKGMVTYFVSMKPGHFKVYGMPEDSFWCCTGTGMENHAKYVDTIYFHGNDELYVNLFMASRLEWKAKEVVVTQETKFPDEGTSRLKVRLHHPVRFAMKVRRPSWADEGFAIQVNGQPVPVETGPGSYVTIQREWVDGDSVEIQLPMKLRLERLPGENQRVVAVMVGPIVLAGELGIEGLKDSDFWLKSQCDRSQLPTPAIPQMVCEPEDFLNHIEPVPGKPLTYVTKGIAKPNEVTLSPLYKLHFQRYSVYWKLLTPDEWNDYQKRQASDEAARKAEEARVIDVIHPGESQSETDHMLLGENTTSGEFRDRKWRSAKDGWFSYTFKLPADRPTFVRCTYWGPDRERAFDVLANGVKVAEVKLPKARSEGFIDEEYEIPSQAIEQKSELQIKVQSTSGQATGGVFEIKLLRAVK